MNKITAMSFNVRGLSDPHRAESIGGWLKSNKLSPMIIGVQEVKVSGELLLKRLNTIDNRRKWVISSHDEGKGGVAIGILDAFYRGTTDEKGGKGWASFTANIKGIKVTFVSVYAPNATVDRKDLWEELTEDNDSIVLFGDFNMVEETKDRWRKMGAIIRGSEKENWLKCKDRGQLIDLGEGGSFTWANNQVGPNRREARLDRFYASKGLSDKMLTWEVKVINSCMHSDHKPVFVSMDFSKGKRTPSWFKADPRIFGWDFVKRGIESIWHDAFQSDYSKGKAWEMAVQNSQIFLKGVRKEVAKIRAQRRDALEASIVSIQIKAREGDTDAQKELVILESKMVREESIKAEQSKIYYREWWAGKIDKPTKEFFHLIRKKS